MDGTSRFIKEGETSSAALIRLVGGLKATNEMFKQLGIQAFESSLAGGDLATQLSNLFGGFDALTSSLSTYYANYYSEEERRISLVGKLDKAFTDLGYTLPKSTQELRDLISAQDLTTEAGQTAFAKLVGLSGSVTTLYGSLDSATSKMKEFTNSILDYIANLSRTEGSTSTSYDYAKREFANQLGLAAGGNESSLGSITSYADQVIQTAKQSAKSQYEYDKIIGSVKAELLGLTNGSTPGTILTATAGSTGNVTPIETVADNTKTTQEILQQILDKLGQMQAEDRAEGVPLVTNLSDIAKVIKRADNGDSLRMTDVTPT
jgi:hypothetical protein